MPKTLIFTVFFGNYNFRELGGPDGELAASIRYLSQKFTMVTPEAKATLNDIATEEFVYHIYHSKNNPFLIIQKRLPFGSLFVFPGNAVPGHY